jgi:hypothetical protein
MFLAGSMPAMERLPISLLGVPEVLLEKVRQFSMLIR